jgi:hypothetical protein
MLNPPIICQDRLGTSIRETAENKGVLLQAL